MNIVTILYPTADDSTFDVDYYTERHMPMFIDALGDNVSSWGAATTSGDHHLIVWVTVRDLDAFNATMAEHGATIMADIPNYTTVSPQMIIGEVVAQG